MAESQIRNIIQTHAERTIIKQAPDLVVYLDGLPYLINNWTPDGPVVVNFNDFVVGASGAADLNTFIPSATVNLSIPNHQRHLFIAPGGNTVFYTMAEIKIFSKGYYMTSDGQSVYERVFWGVISNISQVESNTSLEVTFTCKGILYLLDLMQINLSPSAMTSIISGTDVTPFTSVQAPLNPVLSIRDTFLTSLGNAIGNVNGVQDPLTQTNGLMSPVPPSVSQVYVTKWIAHLKDMNKGVRLFGLKQDLSDCTIQPQKSDQSTAATTDKKHEASIEKQQQTEAQAAADPSGYNSTLIKEFLPSFELGNISLMESNITSRLARVQSMVDVMGWEGYQDLDGSIIIKPPLYNLNPLKSYDWNNPETDSSRNPFVINLDERIGSDSLIEDESQVRLTRVAVKGTLNPAYDLALGNADGLLPVGVFYDPVLIRQFGLRFEGTKEIKYIGTHSARLYAYAASELTREIKHWKVYTVTIPMRPELHLGFPIHIPWRDIMGYLENISWTYTRGNSAQMTLTCSMIRTRELWGQVNAEGRFVYTPVKNAILRWCQPEPVTAPGTSVMGSYMTLPVPVVAQMTNLQRSWTVGTMLIANASGDPPDVPGYAWVVQDDKGVVTVPPGMDGYFTQAGVKSAAFQSKFNQGFFKASIPVDAFYCLAVQTFAMPYTDDQGYTLARPFPWGRYSTLAKSLDAFTRPVKAPTGALLPFEVASEGGGTETGFSSASSFLKTATDAFLLTGLGTPSAANGTSAGGPNDLASNSVLQQLTSLATLMSDNITCFVVNYPSDQDPNASGLSPNPFNATATAANTAAAALTPGSAEMSPVNAAAYAQTMATGAAAASAKALAITSATTSGAPSGLPSNVQVIGVTNNSPVVTGQMG